MGRMPPLDLTASLQRLAALRRVEVVAQSLVLILAVGWMRYPLPVPVMVGAILALALANLRTDWQLRRSAGVSPRWFFLELCLDVGVLTLLLYFAGGSANPFVSLYLIPLTIAAAALPSRLTWAMAAVTLGAYTFLLFFNLPLPAPQGEFQRLDALLARASGMPAEHAGHSGGFALHVLGMWFNFLVSALIVAYFLSKLAANLRQRDQELAKIREQVLRHEQILSLGTLAASAAHKLGTPLSTMAVVLREMELAHGPTQPELAEDLGLLKQQVGQCKDILSNLLANAGASRLSAAAPEPQPLDRWLAQTVADWQLLRPQIPVVWETPSGPAPQVCPDRTLEYALTNLLDNAADASPQGVSLQWGPAQGTETPAWQIRILDRGPGISPAVAEKLGRPFVSTKHPDGEGAGGMGIGFFLTNASIENLGGRVELLPRQDGPGTCTRITLPLAALLPGQGALPAPGATSHHAALHP
ncbi:HAMP domain-containing histidine kinase [Azospira inquinata]|uniref:histidine kinase n=2 Tax=Azospira inquinata TaxID=2785627 RepID=A0A975XVP8_9RHOO|nr:HAMP domain-containing histidine kinase [Azospira inquinata]QWT50071.1 HAMP domain-containing histidine kinase [Azospira inquinata]